jgi:hydroxyacylglutathione hydrolase
MPGETLPMIIERTEHPDWLSNAYLVADGPGGHGVLIDGNGVAEPLFDRIERDGITVSHVLCTHEHGDHVVDLTKHAARLQAALVMPEDLEDGHTIWSGDLEIRALDTPGHTARHFAFVVNGSDCFTGDVLFKQTVGGTSGAGGSYPDLKHSIMERLLELPAETHVHPGHREPTTIGDERESNPFIRVWRGLDPEQSARCRVAGEEATLVLWAPDYDGGYKAWVRFPSGDDAIVGGSRVERLS